MAQTPTCLSGSREAVWPTKPDGGGDVASLLDAGLEADAKGVGHRVVVPPDGAVLDVDGVGQVGGHDDEAVVRHVVHVLDDLGDGAAGAADVAGLLEQLDANLLLLAGQGVGHGDLLGLHWEIGHLQARVLEGIDVPVDAEGQVVVHGVADLDERSDIHSPRPWLSRTERAMSMFCLNWMRRSRVVGDGAVLDAHELDAEAVLESAGQGPEIVAVHGEAIGMAGVADNLLAVAGNLAVDRAGPPSLHRASDHDHGPVIGGVPFLHGLEGGDHLVIVVAVLHGKDVPSVGGPLVLDAVALVLGLDDAADQFVVDSRVVVGKEDAEPLPDLLGHCLGLHLLGVAGGHGELSLDGHDLEAVGSAHHVPEGRFSGRGRDADAGGTAIHVVGHIGSLGVSRQCADAADLRLGHEGMVLQVVVPKEGFQGPLPAAEPEAVDGQEGDVGVDVVAVVAGEGVAAGHGLAHDEPEGIGNRCVVAAGQHELVGVGVLGPAVVVAQAAEVRPTRWVATV